MMNWPCLINVKKLIPGWDLEMHTSLRQFIFPGCWGKGSIVALFLMLCREWWLLLLPDNSTTTFLMLTGLHIHLSALGAQSSHFVKSSFQGYWRHSHKLPPSLVLCNCNQITTFGFCPKTPTTHRRTYTQHGCMIFRVTVIKLSANNKIPPGKKRVTRHHARGAMMQAAEPLQPYKAMHQSSGSKWPNLSTTAPLLHPHETSPTLQKWKMKNIMTSHTAAKRILIEFNCRGDWTQRSCCVRLIRGRLCPEGQR